MGGDLTSFLKPSDPATFTIPGEELRALGQELQAQVADGLGGGGMHLFCDVPGGQLEIFVGPSFASLTVRYATGRDTARVIRDLDGHAEFRAAVAALELPVRVAVADFDSPNTLQDESHGFLGVGSQSAIYSLRKGLLKRPLTAVALKPLVLSLVAAATRGALPYDTGCQKCGAEPTTLSMGRMSDVNRLCAACSGQPRSGGSLLAGLLGGGNTSAGHLERLEARAAEKPDCADTRHALARAYDNENRLAEAFEACQEAVRLDPTHAEAAELLAQLQERLPTYEPPPPLPPAAAWLEDRTGLPDWLHVV